MHHRHLPCQVLHCCVDGGHQSMMDINRHCCVDDGPCQVLIYCVDGGHQSMMDIIDALLIHNKYRCTSIHHHLPQSHCALTYTIKFHHSWYTVATPLITHSWYTVATPLITLSWYTAATPLITLVHCSHSTDYTGTLQPLH